MALPGEPGMVTLLLRLRSSWYGLPECQQTLTGRVWRHEDGYGFVHLDDNTQEDIYIPRPYLRFVYRAARFCPVGQRTGQTYRLGDRVRVDNISVARRQVDLSLLQSSEPDMGQYPLPLLVMTCQSDHGDVYLTTPKPKNFQYVKGMP